MRCALTVFRTMVETFSHDSLSHMLIAGSLFAGQFDVDVMLCMCTFATIQGVSIVRTFSNA